MRTAIAARVPDAVREHSFSRRAPFVVLGTLMVSAAILLVYAGRHLTFFFDEWTFVLTRRGSGLHTFLDPHNGHLSLFPVVVYKILFALFGLRHYTPYRVVGIALHLLCCGLLCVIAGRRLGPWGALVPATLLMFMGTAFQDLLWPFQIGYLGSVASGLGALALLERRGRAPDLAVAGLLAWSLASSGVGIPFLLAAASMMLVRRDPWRRFWVVVVPAILYLAWYSGWATGETTSSDALLGAPQYVASAAAAATAGIAGLDAQAWGAPLAVTFLTVLAVSLRTTGSGPSRAMLVAAAVGAVSFWVLTAVTRAGTAEPGASRYLYVGAVFIFVVGAGARIGADAGAVSAGLTLVLALAAVIANLHALRDGERGLRSSDTSVLASLAAVQIAAPSVSPAFIPDPSNAPQLPAGPYLAAVRDLGSPAPTPVQLARAAEAQRQQADLVLERAEQIEQAPASINSGPCPRLVPTSAAAQADLSVPPGRRLLLRGRGATTVRIFVRRFAAEFGPSPIPQAGSGGTSLTQFPADRAPSYDWTVRVRASGPVALCLQ